MMSTAPTSKRAPAERETRRARMAVLAATVGIAATLLAYGLAPGVRHAVGRAAHSVKHAVSHVLDPDAGKKHAPLKHAPPKQAPPKHAPLKHAKRVGPSARVKSSQ